MEGLVSEIPVFWWKPVDVLTINPTSGNQLLMSYHRRKKILGMHVPNTYTGTRVHMLKELAVTLQAIGDYGVIPSQLTPRKVQKYLQCWDDATNEGSQEK